MAMTRSCNALVMLTEQYIIAVGPSSRYVYSVQKLIPVDFKYNNDQNSKNLIDVNLTRFFHHTTSNN